eukprot:9399887-Pyramimonas_sp.AAC.1
MAACGTLDVQKARGTLVGISNDCSVVQCAVFAIPADGVYFSKSLVRMARARDYFLVFGPTH